MLLVESNLPDSDLFTFLQEQRMQPNFRPGLGVSIPARFLTSLAALNLPISVSEAMRPLWLLISYPPADSYPATVEASHPGYDISWESFDGVSFDERVDPSLARLLGVVDVPIVATDEVWQAIERDLPTMGPSGTASYSPEGFVKITTSRPQLLETSNLPGLFKITPSTFGVCAAFTEALAQEPGLRWATARPHRNHPAIPVPAHLALAPHIKLSLPRIASDLATLGSKAIVWESGLGRRILVLAALEVLDAYPAVVVCAPHSVWAWRRHVDMVQRTCGILGENNDVHLITYHDLALRKIEPQALVFDGLTSQEAAAVWPTLEGLHKYTDAFRIAVEDSWPDDPEESRRLMEVLRPAEFSTKLPMVERYPADPLRRLQEHVEVYLDRRTKDETNDLLVFRRSSVRTVELPQAQQLAIANAAERAASRTPWETFVEILELVSAGPSTTLSPKIAAAVEIAKSTHSRGSRSALLTRHRRTAQLLRAMLRPQGADFYDPERPADVSVVVFDTTIPDLSAFDHVVSVDYPWSMATLDEAVNPASTAKGPDVTILHADCFVEDRLAIFAARRGESSVGGVTAEPPSASEISQILTPRW